MTPDGAASQPAANSLASIQRYNAFLLLVAGLGGLLYGIDVGIIGGALPYLKPHRISPPQNSQSSWRRCCWAAFSPHCLPACWLTGWAASRS